MLDVFLVPRLAWLWRRDHRRFAGGRTSRRIGFAGGLMLLDRRRTGRMIDEVLDESRLGEGCTESRAATRRIKGIPFGTSDRVIGRRAAMKPEAAAAAHRTSAGLTTEVQAKTMQRIWT